MHGINSFPCEILDQIIQNVEQPVRTSSYFPQFPLVPLLRVCRLWQCIAERRLYRSVSIGSNLDNFTNFYHHSIDRLKKEARAIAYLAMYNDPRCKSRTGDVFVRQFRDSLEQNPGLGKLVTRLRLKGRIGRLDQDRTEDFIKILRMCPDVTHVELQDCHYLADLQKPMKDVLEDRPELLSLIVRNTKHECSDHVLRMCDYLSSIKQWPRLRYIELNVQQNPLLLRFIDDSTPGSDVGFRSMGEYHGSRLREIVLPEVILQKHHLRVLQRVCKFGLRRFEGTVLSDDDTLGALRDCLALWGPTLQVLHLRFTSQPDPQAIVDSIPDLSQIEELEISSPKDIRCLPLSETDLCRKTWMRIIDGIASALEDSIRLPHIRKLAINIKGFEDPSTLSTPRRHLEEVCGSRHLTIVW